MRNGLLAAAAAALLAGCGGGGVVVPPALATSANGMGPLAADAAVRDIQSHLAQPPATPPSGGTGPAGQVVVVTPDRLTLSACDHQIGLFDAVENFRGDVTATVADPSIVSVDPDVQRNENYPTFGGLKNAFFDVTPLAAGTTTITVRDKKGATATVTVTVIGCPEATPPPAPTSSPCVASPTPSPSPSAAPNRRARRPQVGVIGGACLSF